MAEVGCKTIALMELGTNIYQQLVRRGLTNAALRSAVAVQEADYLIIDFKQEGWKHLNCAASKVFALNASTALLENFFEEYRPRQVMGFVDYTSGLEFIYFWICQVLTGSTKKEQVLEAFFPHQWQRGSAFLGLLNSLPAWALSLLASNLHLVLTSVVPYIAPENYEADMKELRTSFNIEKDFLVVTPHLQPVQRIFWLESIGIR